MAGGPSHRRPRPGDDIGAFQWHAAAPHNGHGAVGHASLDQARDLEGARPAQGLDEAIRPTAIAELDAADVGFRRVSPSVLEDRYVRAAYRIIPTNPILIPDREKLIADFNPVNEFGDHRRRGRPRLRSRQVNGE